LAALSSASLSPIGERDVLRFDRLSVQQEKPNRAWQVKPFRSGRAGIEQQDPLPPFGSRLMSMSVDTDVRIRSLQERGAVARQPSLFIEPMRQRNPISCQFDDLLDGKAAGHKSIHIPGHHRHGSNLFKLLYDFAPPDVAGMQNVLDPGKMADDRPIKYPMRIRNDPDALFA
jgi:hypothetical protein